MVIFVYLNEITFLVVCVFFVNKSVLQKYHFKALPGVLGNKGTWPISTGEQGNKCEISKGTREKKTFWGTWEQSTPKGRTKIGKKKKDVTGTYLATFSLHPCFY